MPVVTCPYTTTYSTNWHNYCWISYGIYKMCAHTEGRETNWTFGFHRPLLVIQCFILFVFRILWTKNGVEEPRHWRDNAWWRHQIETFSALLAFVRGIHRSPVNSPHKGQWRGALMFSLICVWINGWVNNRVAGDLRRIVSIMTSP